MKSYLLDGALARIGDTSALSHAILLRNTHSPAPSQSLGAGTGDVIVLTFNQEVNAAASTISIAACSGPQVSAQRPESEGTQRLLVHVDESLPAGRFDVTWEIESRSGDRSTGSFYFHIFSDGSAD